MSFLWGRRALLGLIAAVVALRAVGFLVGQVNLDECDFWLFGRMLQEHTVAYVGVADIKPPLTYLTFMAADLVAGHHRTVAVPLLGIVVVLATALALAGVARAWRGDARVGWAAAWLTLVAGLCEAPSVNAEILMNLPAAGALYARLRAERDQAPRWDVAAGLAAGVATLFKLQAGILLVAFVLAILWRHLPLPGRQKAGVREAWIRVGFTSAGYAAPWAVTVAWCAVRGSLPEFYDWVVRRNVFQISSAHVFSAGEVLPSIAAALGAAVFAWWLALRQARRPGDAFQRGLVILLALTVIPVSIGQRFYEHYFLQFVPPLALLGAPQLVALAGRWRDLSRPRRAGVLALALLPPLAYLTFTVYRGLAGTYPGQDPKARDIATWLRQHTGSSDRMFMWGDYSAIYCLAGRLPGTRYMRTAPHVGDFDPLHLPPGFDFTPYRSERDIAATLADLKANRPAIVVDTSPADVHRWSLFPLSQVPELDRYVQSNYLPVGHPAGSVVYRRRDLIGSSAP
jgi:hypothetical protein